MTTSDAVVRAKGRHKLRELIHEAISVCERYQHVEYAADFSEIIDALNNDARVEAKENDDCPLGPERHAKETTNAD